MQNNVNKLNIEKKNNRILLKFDYNEKLKNELKSQIGYPNCKWDPDGRAWSIKNDVEIIGQTFSLFEKHGINADDLISDEPNELDTEVVANWYRISELNQEYFSYYLNLPETDDIQTVRYRVVNALNNLNESIDVALNFDKVLSTEKLPDDICSKYSLRFQNQ